MFEMYRYYRQGPGVPDPQESARPTSMSSYYRQGPGVPDPQESARPGVSPQESASPGVSPQESARPGARNYRGPGGQFITKNSWRSRKGWETRRAKQAATRSAFFNRPDTIARVGAINNTRFGQRLARSERMARGEVVLLPQAGRGVAQTTSTVDVTPRVNAADVGGGRFGKLTTSRLARFAGAGGLGLIALSNASRAAESLQYRDVGGALMSGTIAAAAGVGSYQLAMRKGAFYEMAAGLGQDLGAMNDLQIGKLASRQAPTKANGLSKWILRMFQGAK